MDRKIPDVTIERLPAYLRILDELREDEIEIVSSAEMGRRTGFSSEQIRKDLAYFGAFGTRGVGYEVVSLQDKLKSILALANQVPIVLVGAGSLGRALARYNRLHQQHLDLVGIFDNDLEKVGTSIAGVEVYHVREMGDFIREEGVRLAVVAVPKEAAQQTVDSLDQNGIRAILNFAPSHLQTSSDVVVKTVDLTSHLQSLAYYTQDPQESITGEPGDD